MSPRANKRHRQVHSTLLLRHRPRYKTIEASSGICSRARNRRPASAAPRNSPMSIPFGRTASEPRRHRPRSAHRARARTWRSLVQRGRSRGRRPGRRTPASEARSERGADACRRARPRWEPRSVREPCSGGPDRVSEPDDVYDISFANHPVQRTEGRGDRRAVEGRDRLEPKGRRSRRSGAFASAHERVDACSSKRQCKLDP